MSEKVLSETKFRFLVDLRMKADRDLQHVPLVEMTLGELLYLALVGDGDSRMQDIRGQGAC
jgi:hypothetical protein